MHEPTPDYARGIVAALAVILTALAVASLYVPPLGGVAAVAMVLGVLALVAVVRGEGVAR